MANDLSEEKLYDITVAVPVYNGAQRLPKVLEQLRRQKTDESLRWEIIVADNNSSDYTASIVREFQAGWPSHCNLRYCFVAHQGAAFARQRAVELACGELVAFLDDDNIPALDWVKQVYNFANQNPQVGAFGSRIHGEYESSPPPGFEYLSSFLAIVERGNSPHCYLPQSKVLPPGAGLVVRRKAWLEHVPKTLFLNHKGKNFGLASEDLEAIIHIQQAGWEVWHNPKMVVYHQIPSWRLTEEYLVSLIRCIGLSRYYIRLLRVKNWKWPLAITAYMLNDLYRLGVHWIRQISGTKMPPIVAACQQEYLASTLGSPWFLTTKVVKDTWRRFKEPMPKSYEDWLDRLTQAFEEEHFQLHGQPVLTLAHCHKLVAFQTEVLLRLVETTETDGLQLRFPRDFMAAATYLKLFHTIDCWVLRTFFEQQQLGGYQNKTSLISARQTYSFNVSADSMANPRFTSILSDQIINSNYPAENLCFEISAQALITHHEQASKFMHELKEIGCQVTLDGCFKVSHFQRVPRTLPIDFCKISSHLLKPKYCEKNGSTRISTNMIHAWGAERNIKMIIKDVENNLTLKHIKQANFAYAQGYALASPKPLEISPHKNHDGLYGSNSNIQRCPADHKSLRST
jgi:EAL domain-containing protein (putative c-di-GMP-specific phosphodiesterase class I)/glycosyltransferase involved in cell wall biosynthesis